MNRARTAALTGLGLAIVAAGCFEKLSGPTCTPMTWSVDTTIGDTIVTTRGLKYIQGPDTGSGGAETWCNNVAVH